MHRKMGKLGIAVIIEWSKILDDKFRGSQLEDTYSSSNEKLVIC